MATLFADINAYGTYARATALADVLEVQALSGTSWAAEDLTDYVRDSQWAAQLGERFDRPERELAIMPDSSGPISVRFADELDVDSESVGRIYDILSQRAQLLGDAYPFQLTETRLNYRGTADFEHSYLVLLAITVLHSYAVPVSPPPHQYFEDYVTNAFAQKGYLAANLARYRRESANFSDALINAGFDCELWATPEAATVRKRAQEEGGDIIAHMSWSDSRRIHWTMVSQVTCGVSDSWPRKMSEAAPYMWQNLLGTLTLPQIVFAVPHHVEESQLSYLLGRQPEVFILDRIRLTLAQPEIDEVGLAYLKELVRQRLEFEI
jgi:hypothetical protein